MFDQWEESIASGGEITTEQQWESLIQKATEYAARKRLEANVHKDHMDIGEMCDMEEHECWSEEYGCADWELAWEGEHIGAVSKGKGKGFKGGKGGKGGK